MTSKERAALRAQANTIETTLIVGKGGVSEQVLQEASNLLDAHELIKGKVLETAMLTAREASDAICEVLGAEGIGCVGTKFIVWRKSEKLEQEKKTAAKPAAAKPAKKRNGNYNPVKVSNTRRKEQLRERKQKQKEYFHEAAVKSRPPSREETAAGEWLREFYLYSFLFYSEKERTVSHREEKERDDQRTFRTVLWTSIDQSLAGLGWRRKVSVITASESNRFPAIIKIACGVVKLNGQIQTQ